MFKKIILRVSLCSMVVSPTLQCGYLNDVFGETGAAAILVLGGLAMLLGAGKPQKSQELKTVEKDITEQTDEAVAEKIRTMKEDEFNNMFTHYDFNIRFMSDFIKNNKIATLNVIRERKPYLIRNLLFESFQGSLSKKHLVYIDDAMLLMDYMTREDVISTFEYDNNTLILQALKCIQFHSDKDYSALIQKFIPYLQSSDFEFKNKYGHSILSVWSEIRNPQARVKILKMLIPFINQSHITEVTDQVVGYSEVLGNIFYWESQVELELLSQKINWNDPLVQQELQKAFVRVCYWGDFIDRKVHVTNIKHLLPYLNMKSTAKKALEGCDRLLYQPDVVEILEVFLPYLSTFDILHTTAIHSSYDKDKNILELAQKMYEDAVGVITSSQEKDWNGYDFQIKDLEDAQENKKKFARLIEMLENKIETQTLRR